MKRAFDLTAAAEALTGEPKAKDFVNAVRKLQSATSVSTDLMEVKQSVDELRRLRQEVGSSSHIARALLLHAVIVYCRATHSRAVKRYNVGVIGAYSKEQRKAHEEIVTLRDKVLAHFGEGDGWHDERVIYLEQPRGDAITAVHRRVNSDSQVFDNLYELLEVAIPYVKAKEADRANEIDDELAKSPELFKVIHQIAFDPQAFYREALDSVERFWEPDGFSVSHTLEKTTKPPNASEKVAISSVENSSD